MVVTLKIIGLVMFTIDLGKDSFLGIHFINIGKVTEGIMVLIFAILPTLCISLRLVIPKKIG